ncbi:MAG: hypothetical protein AAFQ15_03115 [Pseudomonadota bacterium]
MSLVEKPDPRKKLMLAAGIDSIFVIIGVALFLTSGSMLWVILALAAGAAVSAPMIISALRELKEQSNASG